MYFGVNLKQNKKTLIVLILATLLYFAIPGGHSWGAQTFQTVPTAGPPPTKLQSPVATSNPPTSIPQPTQKTQPQSTSRPTKTPIPTLQQLIPTFTSNFITNSPIVTTEHPTQLSQNTPTASITYQANQGPLIPSQTGIKSIAPQETMTTSNQDIKASLTPTINVNPKINDRFRWGLLLIIIGGIVMIGAILWFFLTQKRVESE
jgi:hypothetical protein